MDISEIRANKQALEKALLAVIHANVAYFEKHTGENVSGVSVYFSPYQDLAHAACSGRVTRVDVEVKV